ncbi:M15 family metallopeptidase [Paenibacillus sp. strain BS8-2]
MPSYQPLPQPPSRLPERGPTRRVRRLRGVLLLLFVISIGATIAIQNADHLGRYVPFLRKPAPPITELHPIVKQKTDQLVESAAKLGITIVITDSFRSHDEQDKLYAQGRTGKGPIVTQVRGGGSYHNYGLAVDFAIRTKKGSIVWDMELDGNRNGKSDWHEVVAVAKNLGFSWGGDWKSFKDYPHLQMDFGYSISELQRGYRPPEQQKE